MHNNKYHVFCLTFEYSRRMNSLTSRSSNDSNLDSYWFYCFVQNSLLKTRRIIDTVLRRRTQSNWKCDYWHKQVWSILYLDDCKTQCSTRFAAWTQPWRGYSLQLALFFDMTWHAIFIQQQVEFHQCTANC